MTRYGYARRGQRERLHKAGCEKVFTEDTTDMRPELMACLAEMGPGDTLVVTSLDEVGRVVASGVDLVEWLGRHEQYLVTLDEGLDTSRAKDRLMLDMMGVFARYEEEHGEDR